MILLSLSGRVPHVYYSMRELRRVTEANHTLHAWCTPDVSSHTVMVS